jgi:uncharacterized protein
MPRVTTVEHLRATLGEPRPATLAKILPELDELGKAFIARAPFLMMATRDANGGVEVSPKGDVPGFVQIEDARTLLLPERAGNNLAFGLQNIIDNGEIALIFIVPSTSETFRVSGRAEIYDDAGLLSRLGTSERPALLAIRVHINRCFFHCARSMLRAGVWRPETWGDRIKVSFGKIIAPRVGGDAAMADQIDQRVDDGMTRRLWRNDTQP